MTLEASAAHERFRAIVERRFGLAFDDSQRSYVQEALVKCAKKAKLGVSEWLNRVECAGGPDELGRLAQEVTTTETYFFRHEEQLTAFCDVALGERRPTSPLRILSAGCSSGEEAYSLAILIREKFPAIASETSIVGIDVNARVLEKAARGRYSEWSLRKTPADLRTRWFTEDRGEWTIDPSLRRMVRFEFRNLNEEDPVFWKRDAFDIVFCRNVLMYFTRDASQGVARRISESLVPGGFFFVGHAETWRGLSHDSDLCQTHDTFYYRRRDRLAPAGTPPPEFPDVTAEQAMRHDWIGVIEQSTTRIAALAEPPAAKPRDPDEPSVRDVPPWDATLAAQLIHEERFSEVESLLGMENGSDVDPNRLLLRAVLCTRGGDIPAAERACGKLLALDDRSAGGRYLMALCRESVGDRQGTKEHASIAVRADPTFSLPRLHLGLLARRAGELMEARRLLSQALALLEREDVSRLRLFGGGFSREALLDLCRAELLACGGPS